MIPLVNVIHIIMKRSNREFPVDVDVIILKKRCKNGAKDWIGLSMLMR